jgi:hypothetical protein
LKRLQILAALLCVGAAATVPANAKDRTPADRGNGLSTCEERYLALYEKANHAGIDVGRNLVDDGLLTKDGIEPITDARACSEADQLEAALNPPEPVTASPSAEGVASPTPATTTVAPVPVAPSGGCPASMAGEATSPDAVNPSSGAAGCYQVLPSTAAAMGPACSDVNSPDCLAAICSKQGNSAWAASGSTPCG